MLYPAELRVHWSAAIRDGGKVVQGLICRWKLLAGRFPADCVHDRIFGRAGEQYPDQGDATIILQRYRLITLWRSLPCFHQCKTGRLSTRITVAADSGDISTGVKYAQ